MKFQIIIIGIIFLFISISGSYSQVRTKVALTKVSKLTHKIITPHTDKKEQVKAIYDWITHHIKLSTNPRKKVFSDPHKVIQKRKTNQLGFSNLFHQMCQVAGIPSLQVQGYSKSHFMPYKYRAINSFHYWNLIKIESKWYAVDATFGSGDLKYRTNFIKTKIFKQPHFSQKIKFIRNPSEEYFCPSPDILNETHIPNIPEFQLTLDPRPVNPLFEIDSTAHLSPINYTDLIEKFYNTTLWRQKQIEGNKASEFNPINHFDLALTHFEYCDFHFQEGATDDIKFLNALKVKIDSASILFRNHLDEINRVHKEYLLDYGDMNRNVSRINSRLESTTSIVESHIGLAFKNNDRANGFQIKTEELENLIQNWKYAGSGPKKPNPQQLNKLKQQISEYDKQLSIFNDSIQRIEYECELNHDSIINLQLLSLHHIHEINSQFSLLNVEMEHRFLPKTKSLISVTDSLITLLNTREKDISRMNNIFRKNSNKLFQYLKKKEVIASKYRNIIRRWSFDELKNKDFKLNIKEFEDRLINDYLIFQRNLKQMTSWFNEQKAFCQTAGKDLLWGKSKYEKFNIVYPHFLSFIAIRENNYFSEELELAKMMISKSSALQRSIGRKTPTK
ncbi:transglutaminase domain-containing protein [Flexithrix dorotheae]|uniref:transglutaminase domain-containing protein n=1 Tax=Flexithrix dorotheae TaxID=70993 RepID=UPI00036308D6|nr:transglutaminase domain-containing protein [Flexithrix dorotheae]